MIFRKLCWALSYKAALSGTGTGVRTRSVQVCACVVFVYTEHAWCLARAQLHHVCWSKRSLCMHALLVGIYPIRTSIDVSSHLIERSDTDAIRMQTVPARSAFRCFNNTGMHTHTCTQKHTHIHKYTLTHPHTHTHTHTHKHTHTHTYTHTNRHTLTHT